MTNKRVIVSEEDLKKGWTSKEAFEKYNDEFKEMTICINKNIDPEDGYFKLETSEKIKTIAKKECHLAIPIKDTLWDCVVPREALQDLAGLLKFNAEDKNHYYEVTKLDFKDNSLVDLEVTKRERK